MSGVEQVTQIDDTHTHCVISLGGVTREFDATIVVQHPDQRLAWSSTDGTTHSGVVSFETLDDTHTRVTVEMNWQPAGLIERSAKDWVSMAGRLALIWSGSSRSSRTEAAKPVPGEERCPPDSHEWRPEPRDWTPVITVGCPANTRSEPNNEC